MYKLINKLKGFILRRHVLDYEDVMDLSSDIIYTLDDYGYLKPQGRSTAGNYQGDGHYNFDADDVVREVICKRLNVKED